MCKTYSMARRTLESELADIVNLSVLKEQVSLKELHSRVTKETNNQTKRSLEQKVIALKILVLNNMKYEQTGKEVGVTRKTLWLWWKQYGNMIAKTNPVEEVAIALENDLAGVISNFYASTRKSLKKLDALVDKADTVRQIYPVVEVLKATMEIIKLDIEKKNADGKVQGADFFMNVHQMMVNNIYGDGDKD